MSFDWREDLRLKLEDFVDTLVVKGAKHADVYDAIVAEIANLRKAYERDPDPAEDRSIESIIKIFFDRSPQNANDPCQPL